MDLADAIRSDLRAAADPAIAPGQQAYMKSTMPFLGVRAPAVRTITRAAVARVGDASDLLELATQLWDAASYREERYAAMAVLGVRRLKADPAAVPLVEHMVRTGRWWDITDDLAHRIADLHDARPAETARLVTGWSTDRDLWMRRIAIISQLGRRDRVDPDLLVTVIEPNLADGEFFIRKAIGWALREYARVAPQWVLAYADSHPLSPLSRREALRHVGPAAQ